MLLRYTGPTPVTFTSLGVEVEPGSTFDVPDDEAANYLGRADIEAAAEADAPPMDPVPKKRQAKSTASGDTTPAGPVPDTTDTP